MSLAVVLVPTGAANLASVAAGLRRAGAAPRVATKPRDIETAERIVLPGVGAFAAALESLRRQNFLAPLRDALLDDRPALAVCLGLQLLLSESEESPGVRGLDILSGRCQAFPDDVRVPQMGWNRITAPPDARFLTTGYAYFANSYRLVEPPPACTVATADYAGRFVAALEHRSLLACQFHPELSGPWGTNLLRAWLHQEHRHQSATTGAA